MEYASNIEGGSQPVSIWAQNNNIAQTVKMFSWGDVTWLLMRPILH